MGCAEANQLCFVNDAVAVGVQYAEQHEGCLCLRTRKAVGGKW